MLSGGRRVGWALLVGGLAGLLSGLFGVGGGILIVPGLVLLMGMDQRRAHGTSLAAIVPVAIGGVAGFVVDGSVDWPVAAVVAAGSVGGSLVGTEGLRRVPQQGLRLAFLAFVLATAVRLAFDAPGGGGRGPIDPAMVAGLLVLGLASGTLAGLLGVGGGIVIVPVLVMAFLLPDPVAKGTSLLVIVPTALVGTWRNVRNGTADLRVAMPVGLAGVASAFLGSRIALGMDPRTSSLLFGALLVLVAARMALVAWNERHRPPPDPRPPDEGGGT